LNILSITKRAVLGASGAYGEYNESHQVFPIEVAQDVPKRPYQFN
jgi:hypothetical protein